MNENENKNPAVSLREALASGFERVAAEEAAEAQSAETASAAAEQPARETAADSGIPASPFEAAAEAQSVPQTESARVPAQEAQPQPQAQAQSMMSNLLQLLTALREENAQLRNAQAQSQAALNQQSQLAEEAAVNAVAEPQIPALDIKAIQYMGDEEAAQAIAAWQTAVMEGAVQKAMSTADSKYSALLREQEERNRIAAADAARANISGRAEFSDFGANAQNIERIASFPEFQSMAPEKRYMFAALTARGMAHNPNVQPSVDEIVQMAFSNPDVIKAIETRRAQEVQKTNNSLPTLTASSGMGGASAVPENRVKTREDLENRMRARFGLQ